MRFYDRNAELFVMIDKKSNGSALIMVIIILLSLTTGSMILLQSAYLHRKAVVRVNQDLQAFYYAEAGIYKALWYLSGHEGKGSTWRPVKEQISLMNDQPALITIQDWGGYVKIISEVNYRQSSKRIQVLAGQKPPLSFDYAIVLGEYGYPLVVHGKNRIVGDIRVGLKGVEAGTIRGRGFTGGKFVEGYVERVQNPQIPLFDDRQIRGEMQRMILMQQPNQNVQMIQGDVVIDTAFVRKNPSERLHVIGNITIRHDLESPLFMSPKQLSCTSDITVRGSGNLGQGIMLIAGKLMTLQDCRFTDGLLYANLKIETIGQCRFSGQLFCNHIIRIGSSTILEYPSLIYSEGHLQDNILKGDIFISARSKIDGTVIMNTSVHTDREIRNDTRLEIAEQAFIQGFVYSDHYTLHRGTVLGGIATEAFYLYVSPTTYLNWLRDAVTDRTQLPESFCMPLTFGENQTYDIVKWETIESFIPLDPKNGDHLELPYKPLFEIPTS